VALAAARDIENAKAAKYRSVAMARGANFSAFIVESYGALGGQGSELLKLLNNTLNHVPARPFELSERVVAETLSVALQRGNAFISHTGSLAAQAQAVLRRDTRTTQSAADSSDMMEMAAG
jgi:hypothetical protein